MKKLCRDCGTVKDITEFRKDSKKKSGYGSYCKPCSSERAKQWQRNNPEKRKLGDCTWYQENRGRKKATDQLRAPKYRVRRSQIDRAKYLAKTPEQRREKWNRWYWANEERSLRYKQAQRVIRRTRDADWTLFPDSLAYVEVIAADPCAYCGAQSQTIDHLIPVAQGGTGEWTNLAPACTSCNSSKQDDSPLSYLLRVRDNRIA